MLIKIIRFILTISHDLSKFRDYLMFNICNCHPNFRLILSPREPNRPLIWLVLIVHLRGCNSSCLCAIFAWCSPFCSRAPSLLCLARVDCTVDLFDILFVWQLSDCWPVEKLGMYWCTTHACTALRDCCLYPKFPAAMYSFELLYIFKFALLC